MPRAGERLPSPRLTGLFTHSEQAAHGARMYFIPLTWLKVRVL